MLVDTASVTSGEARRVTLRAAVRTGCDTVEIGGRGSCSLQDELRWTVRDSSVARLYTHTTSGYEARDTAVARFLPRRPGRTWVVVTSQNRGLTDSTLLVVEPEP